MSTKSFFLRTVFLAGFVLVGAAGADAFDTWDGCQSCHGGFRNSPYVGLVDGMSWGSSLHDVHRFSMLGGECFVCHYQQSTDPPVYLSRSDGAAGLEPVSCMGCHGVNPTPGAPNNPYWGAGLRARHAAGGVSCVGCHPSDPPPPPESTHPSYYMDLGIDPCDPYSENFAGRWEL